MLNINYIRRGKAWEGGRGGEGKAEEGERGERVSWKLRETRVRGMRKRVASGDGKGRTRETWAKTFEELHSPPSPPPLEVRGGELRNRLGSLYRALCQKERKGRTLGKDTTAF